MYISNYTPRIGIGIHLARGPKDRFELSLLREPNLLKNPGR